MLRSLYTAATGMEAQQLKMDVISHNLANASTTGFKKVRAEFEELLSETIRDVAPTEADGGTPPAPLQVGLGVKTGATSRSFGTGDMINTQNELDVAIEGHGFFQVIRPGGELAYTRAGNFRVDGLGRLVTQRGEILDPEISFPPDTTEVSIDGDGTVRVRTAGADATTEVGVLELSTFVNPNGLLSIGGNLFVATESSGPAMYARPGERGVGTLAQGFLESANVKAVEEMIDMITTQRSYELSSKVIQTADQMLQRLTQLR
ncbi:MAG TPA: flagellar basal-body rod protein FlgG [Vulgatibacter sp.]|nr:flagellar basal-body rod protein FlgG [Vulgatibacter sp.]